jgi:flagellin-like hook-associated protein FlgL
MPIVINTNTSATVSAFNLARNNTALQKSLARLSSGSKIVHPSDDAGGLAVSYKLTAQVHRLDAVRQNVANGVSFLQVQDGALTVTGNILDRMSELKTMSLDMTKNASDRANYDTEFTELQQQLGNIMSEKFNDINLFDQTNSPVPIYTTEDGATGKVDITRHGTFENLNSRHLKELEVAASLDMTISGDKLTAATATAELTGYKPGETVTFTFHGTAAEGGNNARAQATADSSGVIANTTQLTILDGGSGYSVAPSSVYADNRAEDSAAKINDWTANTAYADGDVVRLDGESYVILDGNVTVAANTDKTAFKALAGTSELQNATEPLAKVLQFGDGAGGAGDVNAVGDVVYNDKDGNYYMAAGAGADYATDTTALNLADEVDTNAGEYVKLGSELPTAADYDAWDAGKAYNQGDIVSFRDSNDKMRLYVTTSAAATIGLTDPEIDTDNIWTELSQYKSEGADLLDDSSKLSDYSISDIVGFIQTLATARAQNGAEAKHLQYADEMLVQNRTNIEAANSRIKDVDVAIESTNYARNNILVQSSAAMLAQANTMSSIALSLLGQ